MITVAEAQARIRAALTPLPAETVALPDAFGRVLAEPLTARLTQPPFAASSMDGWAVRATDVAVVPARLRRIGESAAGHRFSGSLAAGEAVRIFTGAPLPDGADAVVMQEDAEADGDHVLIRRSVPVGRFLRPAGHDFTEGEELLPSGRRLTARDIALAACANRPWLRVHRRPRVAILATGDEIALPGELLGPDQIVSSNALGLCATVAALGGIAHNLGVAGDTAESLAAMAAAASGCDLLVTTGGSSKGDYDFVGDVLGGRGFSLLFDRVAMRPGKAVLFGRTLLSDAAAGTAGLPLLGLPGNPVSTGVCAILFLKPALEALQGLSGTETETIPALLGETLRANGPNQDHLRATLTRNAAGDLVATAFPRQDTALMSLLAKADCLIVRPPHAPAAAAGEGVEVLPLPGGAYKL